MPNDCWCKVRIAADKEQITTFCETDFSFEKLRPRPVSEEDWYQWNIDNWGTKWDRSNYKLVHKGEMGLEMKFTTAWAPPYDLFYYLVETHHDVWIKCDWSEEGGQAGVIILRWDDEEKRVAIKNMEWDDWCLEEWAHRMRD